MEKTKSSGRMKDVSRRVALCLVILAAGAGGMIALAAMKKPPAEARSEERAIRVEVVRAAPESVQIAIAGFGEARPVDIVTISPEVAGKLTVVHRSLEVGMTVSRGDLLFRIDPTDYRANRDNALAGVRLWENTVERLGRQYELDKARLITLERSRDLAQAEFMRKRRLFEEDSVGTRSNVDAAEQQSNAVADQADQMAKAVAVYPIQIREAQNNLTSARAQLEKADANLARCDVRAPFDGRITSVAVEQGQYVSPGLKALVLANDAMLEIKVPLDSRDLRRWLRFTDQRPQGDGAWFSSLEPVDCTIAWTEDSANHVWTGRLDRVVTFDQITRTITVAVRVSAHQAAPNRAGALPLVEGMFCRVQIPGRTLDNVIRLPRWAVSFQNTAYVAVDNRLKTVAVEVAHVQGDEVLVSAGLAAGDRIITTRLVDPLENALLDIAQKTS
ncbi:MAG: efflux RND transporter periplasmic adaptor subunit [Desulfobacterales bacterium]|nr:efflux RND transporter periplasmic adaptor subunit [Desulfobacterales bacterium]